MIKTLCVFDFETDEKNPKIANPVEVACIMIDPFTLDIIANSEFVSDIRPPDIESPEYLTKDRLDTIGFHCKNKKISQEELLEQWKKAPTEDFVWSQFVEHVGKYNKSNSQWDAPIAAGMNIKNFDMPIVERLNERYKVGRLFNHELVDIRDLAFLSLVWDTSLKSRSMDSLRKYFGIDGANAHTALKDVMDSAMLVSRFLKYHKSVFKATKFKNSFKEAN